jgi:hypothetical protein
MAISKNTLILLSIVLVLTIVSTYYINKNKKEHFESQNIYFGILPKYNHHTRNDNIIYYNDPIFIEYGDKYVLLSKDKALGTKNNALIQISYLKPIKSIKNDALNPVSYMDKLYLKSFPETPYNNKFNKEFKLVPYSNNNPYLQINDIVSFKNDKEEYLSINPITLEFELLNSISVPNNALFKITNSPQCFTNYVKYGIDVRNQNIDTMQSIVKNMRNVFDKDINSLDNHENDIKMLRKQRLELKENINKYQNNKDYIQNEMSIIRQEYDSNISNIRDKYSTIKLNTNKDFAHKKLVDENEIQTAYLKEMKLLLDKGCSS